MNILIIDDDEKIRNFLIDILSQNKHNVFSAENGIIGCDFFLKEKIDLCFLDLWMPEIGGIDILKRIKTEYPYAEVVMISGDAKIDHAVKATKIGAFDFIEKPISMDSILNIVKVIENKLKTGSIGKIKNEFDYTDILIGECEQIKAIKKLIDSAAKSDARILISGENGTGKELIAKGIQSKSSRKNNPFITVNCAAIPENLIESELFGYVKGAFTGAINDSIGKFESAHTGTLFLDEVADMSLSTQAKVLRVLQDMKIYKIGSNSPITVDVRIISATNKDLALEVKDGAFREDLYYRLNVIPIYIPPLRERKEDIPLIINYFLKKFNLKNDKKTFTGDSIAYMQKYPWPGNVRQLRNIIERLFVMVPDEKINLEHVNKYLDEDIIKSISEDVSSKYEKYKLNTAMDEFEKDFIEKKLIENNCNLSKTAKVLGVYPSNLHSKIHKFGIAVDQLKQQNNKKKF